MISYRRSELPEHSKWVSGAHLAEPQGHSDENRVTKSNRLVVFTA